MFLTSNTSVVAESKMALIVLLQLKKICIGMNSISIFCIPKLRNIFKLKTAHLKSVLVKYLFLNEYQRFK